ncbi:MAG: class I SAM-dependent methyltransferase [Candidatus Aegiribacteria sp.]|nr:class I SAM-dependent methyltransferase [Candidatus Aegiribacteria sp.]
MKKQDITKNLTLDSHGIWVTRTDHVDISYPEEGNRQYFQIEDKSFWFKHRNDCIVAALNLYPPEGPVFDVGGGNGFVTRRLLDEGFEAALIEPGPTGAFNAKIERNIPTVFRATLENCGFPEDSLSAISLFDVLEHIEDDGKFLTEIRSCLKPGGYLYITVPAYEWLWSRSDINADHYRRYNPEELVHLLSKHFNVLFITCFFRVLMFPILIFRVVPYRLGLTKSKKVLTTGKEHGLSGGFPVRAVQRFLSPETEQIIAGQSKVWGTSCLCIAQKRI